ncbi:EF-hand domain-containing protein [Streptomyces sp. NBC_00536]|uniref:EF-hand domain-containing protein n=1 Tax=Streptomyces sp. NBC_00536 TaxID=2975769 RepID=UPI002E8071C6|nr:EF-hand domain-containing protein [Streptomyces sp. NBC_00536]WUC77528.1 EF-hand domain-containing protein [Streptomyces sp. NBC_00536]
MNGTTGVLEQKLRRFFAMLDLDGDGRLTEDDALAIADRLAAAFDVQDTAKITRLRSALSDFWRKDLAIMAADGSGSVNVSEFVAGMPKALGNDRAGVLERLTAMVAGWMDIADTDGNGLIDEDEYVTMFSKTVGASPADLKVAFAKLDRDGNGTLDREEIRRATEEYGTSEDPQAPGNWLLGPL